MFTVVAHILINVVSAVVMMDMLEVCSVALQDIKVKHIHNNNYNNQICIAP